MITRQGEEMFTDVVMAADGWKRAKNGPDDGSYMVTEFPEAVAMTNDDLLEIAYVKGTTMRYYRLRKGANRPCQSKD